MNLRFTKSGENISKALIGQFDNKQVQRQHYNQYKLFHRRTVHNKLLNIMGISETTSCLFSNNCIEAVGRIYPECENVVNLWKITEEWVINFYDCHFKIADLEKIYSETSNDQIRQQILVS